MRHHMNRIDCCRVCPSSSSSTYTCMQDAHPKVTAPNLLRHLGRRGWLGIAHSPGEQVISAVNRVQEVEKAASCHFQLANMNICTPSSNTTLLNQVWWYTSSESVRGWRKQDEIGCTSGRKHAAVDGPNLPELPSCPGFKFSRCQSLCTKPRSPPLELTSSVIA